MLNNLKDKSWRTALKEEFNKSYMQELNTFLQNEAKEGKIILPPKKLWFNALNTTPLNEVKVVILGQDPYPTKGHGHGLCFSVLADVKPLPKSLLNINKELLEDVGVNNAHCGYLQPWAKQGVLLINAVFTVEEGKANAHKNRGWEKFTDKIIERVSSECENVVFLLWGAYAQKKGTKIDDKKHLIIKDPHPSPLSVYRGFWGSKPFSKINAYLEENGKSGIDWRV